jgi:hypothetical protein
MAKCNICDENIDYFAALECERCGAVFCRGSCERQHECEEEDDVGITPAQQEHIQALGASRVLEWIREVLLEHTRLPDFRITRAILIGDVLAA